MEGRAPASPFAASPELRSPFSHDLAMLFVITNQKSKIKNQTLGE
jgi:hypothetical protein